MRLRFWLNDPRPQWLQFRMLVTHFALGWVVRLCPARHPHGWLLLKHIEAYLKTTEKP